MSEKLLTVERYESKGTTARRRIDRKGTDRKGTDRKGNGEK